MSNRISRSVSRLGLVSMALLIGCTTQPLLTQRQAPAPQLQANNVKLQEYRPDFMPTFQNSFMRTKQLVRTGNTVIKVAHTNPQQVDQLNELGMDIWMVTPKYVLGQVNEDVYGRLAASRLQFEHISPERGITAKNTFDPRYHTYDEMLAELQAVAAKHPQIASLHDVGDTWEKTQGQANRDLWAIHISGKGNAAQKPGILYMGNHHARELATVEIPLLLIKHLTDNYGKDPQITQLIDTRDIWIIPMVNPDGHIKAEQGQNWRKNNRVNEGSRYRGVDLNRNYGYKWNHGGSSSRPSSDTYHGTGPFSEPETQAVRNFIDQHPNLKIMMSYHSFSNLILWPWGHTRERNTDAKLLEIGNTLGKMTGYRPQQAADLYVASGITDDYTYGVKGLISFTTEIGSWGDGFDPPYSKVSQFWDENRGAAIYLLDMAGKL